MMIFLFAFVWTLIVGIGSYLLGRLIERYNWRYAAKHGFGYEEERRKCTPSS